MAARSIAIGDVILVRYRVERAFLDQGMVVARPLPIGEWRGDPLLTLPVTLPVAAVSGIAEPATPPAYIPPLPPVEA